jgi:hypothetical protein
MFRLGLDLVPQFALFQAIADSPRVDAPEKHQIPHTELFDRRLA